MTEEDKIFDESSINKIIDDLMDNVANGDYSDAVVYFSSTNELISVHDDDCVEKLEKHIIKTK